MSEAGSDALSLGGLRLVLAGTRFPENIGSAARASANFGPCPLHLVKPERWRDEADRAKAETLATSQGRDILDRIVLHDSLAGAVAPCALVVGTTARTGGWRRHMLDPRQAADEIAALLREGEEAALVFGPEDRGLSNADLTHCGRLVTIPTRPEATSLNLAQAVLLLLYECRQAQSALRHGIGGVNGDGHGEAVGPAAIAGRGAVSRRVSQTEKELFFQQFKQALLAIDFLHPDNPDYFFLPLARFFDRAGLRRHEFDLFMGICRQIRNPRG